MSKPVKRTRTVSAFQLQQNAKAMDKARSHERENQKAAKLEQMRKEIFEHLDTHRDQIEDAYEYVVERAGRPQEEFSAERFSQHYKHVKKVAPSDLIKLLLVHITNFSEQELMAIKRIDAEDMHRLLYAS
eukprot:167165-Amphidinium_carterae.1